MQKILAPPQRQRRLQQAAWIGAALSVGLLLALLPPPAGGLLLLLLVLGLAALVEPLVALGGMLLIGPWGAVEPVTLAGGLLDGGQLAFLCFVAVWLLRGLARRRIHLPRPLLFWPLLAYCALLLLTLLDAPSPLTGIREVVKWVEMWLLMVLVVDLGSDDRGRTRPRRVWLLLGLLLLAGLSQAVIGIWQFALRGTGPDHFLIGGGLYRASGTFQQPNPFGGFLHLNALPAVGVLLGLLLAYAPRVGAALRRRSAGTPVRLLRQMGPLLLLAVVVATLAGGLAASWSRGAWLGFAAGLGAMLIFLPRRLSVGLLLALLGAGGGWIMITAGLLPEGITDRLIGWLADFRLGDARGVDITDANFAIVERLAHWQVALDLAREQFWLGVGAGNYEVRYADYALLNWPNALGHAHNYYLNLMAETGIIGLLAYGVLWGTILWQTVKTARGLEGPERGLALGLLGAWVALSVHHLLDKLYVNNIYLHLGVMLGLLQLLYRRVRES